MLFFRDNVKTFFSVGQEFDKNDETDTAEMTSNVEELEEVHLEWEISDAASVSCKEEMMESLKIKCEVSLNLKHFSLQSLLV